MKKTIYLAIGTLMLSSPSYAEDIQISIKDHAFTPSTLTVRPGTKVVWTNHDQDPHTVAESAAQKRFHSGALDTNDSYSYTFTQPGTYTYFCTMHPVMVGSITVK